MTMLRHFTIALALVFLGTQIAIAQNVLVVDNARILRESKAGKDMANKVKNIRDAMAKELEPEGKALESSKKAIDAKLEGKTREQLQQDTALQTQVQSFQRSGATFQQKKAVKTQELAITERKALVNYNQALRTATDAVMKQKNAQVVLDRSQAVVFANAVDVSNDVIAQLDRTSPTITVTREKLPTQPAQ